MIADKIVMYSMLHRGSFGHTLPNTDNLVEALAMIESRPGMTWATRSKIPGGEFVHGMSEAEAKTRLEMLPPGTWNFSPTLPDKYRRCYGHLYDSPLGLRLHYSESRTACRLIREQDGCEQKWLEGVAVRHYLKSIMDQTGYETVDDLIRDYPSHVIEFSVMSSRIYTFGPTNVIIWEVRPDSGSYEGGRWGGRREVDWDEVDRERESLKAALRSIESRNAPKE